MKWVILVILKKPYAFLIKNFRLIHLILTFLIGYLFFRTIKIYNFFNRYVSNVYAMLSDAIPSNYITLFMFLVVIIIITFSLAMYTLMKRKEKPKLFYVLLSAYYLVIFGAYIAYFALFKNFDASPLTIRNAMVLRDLTLIITIPQFGFLAYAFVRAVGFDIKRFNFSKDLKELDIKEEDNEEFEFILGVDSYKYTRMIRRRIREFKYYVLENKFMFTILSGLVGFIIIIAIILNFTVYNRVYGRNQKITANNLSIQVNSSYLTNMDYSGNIIEKGKYFFVVNTRFINNSGLTTTLNLSSYELVTKNGKVYPTLTRNNYFIDLGAGYQKERLENGSTNDYILVYELNKNQLASKYTLRIIDEVEYKAGTINTKVKKINLKPQTYTKTDTVGTYKLGEDIDMFKSILGNTTLNVSSSEFVNLFTYNYEACIRDNCSSKTDIVNADIANDKTLLILKGKLSLDDTSTFAKNKKTTLSFFDAFATIRYDGNTSVISNVTPSSLTEEYVLQVDSAAMYAEKIDLVIFIRGKEYILNLR